MGGGAARCERVLQGKKIFYPEVEAIACEGVDGMGRIAHPKDSAEGKALGRHHA